KMTRSQEVERIAKKLDKMVQKKKTVKKTQVLRELKLLYNPVNWWLILNLAPGHSRGFSSHDGDIFKLPEHQCVSAHKAFFARKGSEEKKKDGSPVRTSSTSKDSGSSEKSTKTSDESSVGPTCPSLPQPVPAFPPAPITTGNVRNKCRELLVAALQTGGDHLTMGVNCQHLAAQIEEDILWEFKSTEMKYKTRLRSRISNLKDHKNPELRRNVLCGNISPQRIASMSAEEMASAELKQIREALTKESIREHQLSKVGGAETDMFICNNCHGKNCTYTQVQIRSADEPMTTFVLCNSCGNRWKFC
uniref:Transcription elongation factor n=1 Tax=Tetraodon nigroviridis TaxID=99883 RepID=H3D194_TETNG